jgi:hypothetical protein
VLQIVSGRAMGRGRGTSENKATSRRKPWLRTKGYQFRQLASLLVAAKSAHTPMEKRLSSGSRTRQGKRNGCAMLRRGRGGKRGVCVCGWEASLFNARHGAGRGRWKELKRRNGKRESHRHSEAEGHT